MMELIVKTGGIYNIALVIFHLLFWRIFNWKEDLQSLSFLNRSIMQVLNLCLTFVFVIFAYISLAHTNELLSTPLGRTLLILMATFWLARSVLQIVFFRLRTGASSAFLAFFVIGTTIYSIPVFFSPI